MGEGEWKRARIVGFIGGYISILMGLAFLGCSSSSSDSKPGQGGGGVTQFGQSIAGQWLSECSQNQNGMFKENLVVNAI